MGGNVSQEQGRRRGPAAWVAAPSTGSTRTQGRPARAPPPSSVRERLTLSGMRKMLMMVARSSSGT